MTQKLCINSCSIMHAGFPKKPCGKRLPKIGIHLTTLIPNLSSATQIKNIYPQSLAFRVFLYYSVAPIEVSCRVGMKPAEHQLARIGPLFAAFSGHRTGQKTRRFLKG
jgi:hypothetical protein